MKNEIGHLMFGANIKKIVREYYEQLYTWKVDNLDEMDQFLKNNATSITHSIQNT